MEMDFCVVFCACTQDLSLGKTLAAAGHMPRQKLSA
jgi:hypothetical protein